MNCHLSGGRIAANEAGTTTLNGVVTFPGDIHKKPNNFRAKCGFVVRSEGAHICCDINKLPRSVNRKVHFPSISAFQRNVLAGIHSGVETYHMVISTLGPHKLKIAALLSKRR
jgi:hypothetical protein